MTDFHFIRNVLSNLSVMVVQIKQKVPWSTYLKRTKFYGLSLFYAFDGNSLALGDNVLAKRQVLIVEKRLHPIHYIIYGAFAEDCDEQSCEETRQPASLSRLRNVALSTMLPLPNLCGNEEAVEEENDFVLQFFEPLLLGNLIEGKDIDIDALVHLDVLESGFRKARTIHPDLHEVERRMRLCVRSLQEEFVAQFFLSNLGKTLIVRSHHAHIHIIVPRQNLPPEVGTNGRAARHEVTDAMLLADALHLGECLIESVLQMG